MHPYFQTYQVTVPDKGFDGFELLRMSPHIHQVVYAASGADVNNVMADGEILLESRRFVRLDVEEIMENVREIANRVRKSIGPGC